MVPVISHVAHQLERMQEVCPGLLGFMNWGLMGGFYRMVRSELLAGPGERVLDFGCGRGSYSHLFDSDSYIGVDVTPSFVRYAPKETSGLRVCVHGRYGFGVRREGVRRGAGGGACFITWTTIWRWPGCERCNGC